MSMHFNLPVSPTNLFLAFLFATLLGGCSSDEEPVTEMKPDSGPLAPIYDMGPAPKLPIPVTDIFRYLPEAPTGIRARPRDPALPLVSLKNVRLLDGFTRVYVETPSSGPFKRVQYKLSKDRKTVERVVATFHRQYSRKDRHESIVEMIKMRLGAPKERKDKKAVLQHWALPEYGIAVRKDLVAGKFFSSTPLDLIYDANLRSVTVK